MAAACALVSCQTAATEPEGKVSPRVELRFQESAVALRPDSASWRLGGEGDRAVVSQEAGHPEVFRSVVALPRELGRDTLKLSTWRYGLRTSVLPYVEGPKIDSSHIVRDQLARDLLVRHQSLSASDAKTYTADAGGVRRVYAECLLSREGMCPDAPPALPVGMDSLALVNDLCRELARRKLPFSAQIQAPFFGWTPARWREVVIQRVQAGILSSLDSAVLFPLEMVVRQKMAVGQIVRAGGVAVPMAGRFAWSTSKKVEAFVEIRSLKGKLAEGFQLVLPQPGATDTSLSLDGKSSLRASASVPAGRYQRVVGVRDEDGLSARWTDTFQVAGMDTVAMVRVQGASVRTVAYDSAKVWVAWKAVPSGFDSVWIDGILCAPRDSIWGVWAEPAAGGMVVVDLRAKTNDGIWIEDRVEIARDAKRQARDTVMPAPSLVPLPGCQHLAVPFDSSRAIVGWQEDSGRVDSVWIQGELVDMTGNGIYRRTIDLSGFVGQRQVFVRSKRGNLVFADTVTVERRPDTIAPRIALGASSFDPVGDSVRVTSTWVVTDNDAVDTVLIAGVPVSRVGNTFSRSVMVDTAKPSIRIQAVDRSANRSSDTLVIAHSPDRIKPILVAMPSTVSRTVTADTSSILVAWRVTDDRLLKMVTIDDSVVVGQGGVYAFQRPLALGRNVSVVKAVDASGNVATDSIVVERRDTQGPRLVRVTPQGSDTTVFDGTDSIEAIWEATDPSGLTSVAIDGKSVTGNGNRYSVRRPIPFGKTRVRMRATDARGNESNDSVLVERIDRTPPRLSLQGPRRDTAVESSTDSVRVSWLADDAWGVKSLEMDRVGVAGASGVYERKVPLAFGWNTLRVRVVDSAGNWTSDSVRIYRPGGNGLRLYRDLPVAADSVVAQAVVSLPVAYFASSPVGVDTVLIDHSPVVRDPAGEYRRDVRLAIGMNSIPVLAVDHDGNRRMDTVKVRRRDQTPPVLVRQPGTADQTVDSTQSSVTVAWAVSDNHAVKQVRINGTAVTSTNGVYSLARNLGYGTNYITVVAFDSAGNATADTVRITRPSPIVFAPSHSQVRLALSEWPRSQGAVAEERRTLALAGSRKKEELS